MRKNGSFVRKEDKQSNRDCCEDRDVLENKFQVKNSEKRKISKMNAINGSMKQFLMNESDKENNKRTNASRTRSRKRSRSQDFSRSFDNHNGQNEIFKKAKKLLIDNYSTNKSVMKNPSTKKMNNDDRV
jgi:hypothetical protein